jgi:hypothetical protein
MSIDLSTTRGSERLLAAWKSRDALISDELVKNVAKVLDNTPAMVSAVNVTGGKAARGLGFTLTYADDDTPRCGNDLVDLLRLLGRNPVGGGGPVVIINGMPGFDLVRMQVQIGEPELSPAQFGPASGGFR